MSKQTVLGKQSDWSSSGHPDPLARLHSHRQSWEGKKLLQEAYKAWFEMIRAEIDARPAVELGSGPGFLRESIPGIIATDVFETPWIDSVVDGMNLPFRSASLERIVIVDVFHHLSDPMSFLREAQRVLKRGGRIIILDVHISPLSYPVYALFHHEPVRFLVNPYRRARVDRRLDPFASNQALTTLVFQIRRRRFTRMFPQLKMVTFKRMSCLLYVLSGGFEHEALISEKRTGLIRRIESFLDRMGSLTAFRNFIVLEKE